MKTKILIAAQFPSDHGLTFSNPTFFVGGADSDYIPVSDHGEIEETFTDCQVRERLLAYILLRPQIHK